MWVPDAAHQALRDLTWIKEHVHFDPPALEATLLDYVHEVDHMAERIQVWKGDHRNQTAPPAMRIGGFLLKRQQGCFVYSKFSEQLGADQREAGGSRKGWTKR